ncbi:TPA: DUF551 domain-containing protein [Enterobacter asburiae]|nr:DUF551 domain-containing protein [Enterobacter asburiae]
MSNIDKQAVQAVADLKAGYTLGHADVAILNELARIALASLEAEPVAWLLSGGGAKNHVSFDSGNAYADPLREVTPLYTAPPAPVSVPAAMEMDDDFDSAFEHGKAVGWNACRAAMLQVAEPVQGWIKCSERMPEMEIEVLAIHVEGHQEIVTVYHSDALQVACGHAYFDRSEYWWVGDSLEDAEPNGSFTHWMPLPAAPQQEA